MHSTTLPISIQHAYTIGETRKLLAKMYLLQLPRSLFSETSGKKIQKILGNLPGILDAEKLFNASKKLIFPHSQPHAHGTP